ncbi:MAG: NUDIX domain-containing protein [Methylobacteriaceae bacterium]|jgi:8-oxo-dGTP pyrophosphatase MutT (NUDIX family)|nr:NUDIX domain-containing protein [Methylobacteriaceae bacterium]
MSAENPKMPERFRPYIATFLIVENNGRYLLSLRRNTGYMDGRYGLVSGHVEENESAASACLREAREEAGLDLAATDIEPLHVMHLVDGVRTYVYIVFITRNYTGPVENREPEKCGGLAWFTRDALPANMAPNIRMVFEHALSGAFYSEAGFPGMDPVPGEPCAAPPLRA